METLINLMTPLGWEQWLVIGLVLLGIEMLIGTFDLLWIGVAALLTALYASGLFPLPESLSGWEAQLSAFVVLSIILVIVGRTAFAGLRKPPTSHPGLNRRGEAMVGRRAVVAGDFSAGAGRIKLGDTTWSAVSLGGEDFREGDNVEVAEADVAVLKVRRL